MIDTQTVALEVWGERGELAVPAGRHPQIRVGGALVLYRVWGRLLARGDLDIDTRPYGAHPEVAVLFLTRQGRARVGR